MCIKNLFTNLIFLSIFLLPIIAFSQTRNLYVEGEGDQMGTIHTMGELAKNVGLELVRGDGSQRLADYRLLNNNGAFRIQYETDNFLSNTGTNRFTILEDGNTGIGCTNPKAKLSICSGEMAFSNSFSESAGDKISLDGYAFDQAHFVGLGYETSTVINQQGQISEFSDLYYKAEGAHRWYNNVNADLGASASMVLTQDGDLGLGTHTPDSKLHIRTGDDASLGNTTNGYFMTGRLDGRNIIIDDNEIMSRDAGGASVLMMQRDGGGVAIGMPSGNSEAPLAIEGDGNQIHFSNGNETTNDWFFGASSPSWLVGGGKMIISTGGNSTNNMMSFDRNTDIVDIQRSGGDIMLCSQENGQVGIGIGDPANLPSAEYLLAVDGAIMAEEVRVELSGSWPDYVFADDYKLMPLAEVEKSIQENKHLPGIPSAATIEADGIELGDMQTKMMEKIEELTLHLIQMKKDNDKLTERVQQLEK